MPTSSKRREQKQASRRRIVALGLCEKCGVVAMRGVKGYCFTHWIFDKLKHYKLGPSGGGWLPHNRQKKQDFADRVRELFYEVQAGRMPLTWEQALEQAFAIRKALNIKWGGRAGLKRTARIIYSVEQKAKALR